MSHDLAIAVAHNIPITTNIDIYYGRWKERLVTISKPTASAALVTPLSTKGVSLVALSFRLLRALQNNPCSLSFHQMDHNDYLGLSFHLFCNFLAAFADIQRIFLILGRSWCERVHDSRTTVRRCPPKTWAIFRGWCWVAVDSCRKHTRN